MKQDEKNKLISEAISETRKKRKMQVCKTFRFKIDRSALNNSQKESLKMFFIETKRLYNYILNQSKNNIPIPEAKEYKQYKTISYLDKDRNEIKYDIKYIGSSVISDTITLMKDSIIALAASKKKGNKIGALRFKTECNSIRLRQYGVTHLIKGNRIKIQGIKKPIRVNGLKQLNKYDEIDYTTACLLYDGYDYYVSLTCFIPKEIKIYKNNIIGVDLGCETTITTSEGEKIKISIGESDRLKGLQARLAKQTKRSNNWYKTKSLIRKEYNHINNKKNDAANKIVHFLTSYEQVIVQDDRIAEWHESDRTSRTVQHSVLGRVKSKLKNNPNVVFLDQWFPTTKHCFECGNDIDIKLNERTFKCPYCGCTIDRDVHAAQNMINYYNNYIKYKPVGTTGSMPSKKISYNQYVMSIGKGSSTDFSG